MTIDKTMTTYNHCGAHHWFDVDGRTKILTSRITLDEISSTTGKAT
ncbi:hypothetical protein [Vibrio breoganii]|nr:hypothetical protein [Vibrio breoganii]